MKWTHNIRNLRDRRRELRRRQTPQEEKIWFELRNNKLGAKFKRQHSIGGYIADFFCSKLNMIVEIDGEIHNHADNMENDRVRDIFLKEMNFKVIRFTNAQVDSDLGAVIEEISRNLSG